MVRETALTVGSQHAIAHNKVMVIVGETVIAGSFNFIKAGGNADDAVDLKESAISSFVFPERDLYSRHNLQ